MSQFFTSSGWKNGNHNNNEGSKPVAPLYITIGPPCAGKTDALGQQLEQDGYPDIDDQLKEVALDEQTNVYQRVPLAAFIFPNSKLDAALGDTLLKSGTTVRDRLLNPSPPPCTDTELRNIILRVAGRMTPQEFADRTRQAAREAGDTVPYFRQRRAQIAEDLIQAVEQVSVQAVGEVLFQMQLQSEELTPQVMSPGLHNNSSAAETDDENELPYHDDDETNDGQDETTTRQGKEIQEPEVRAVTSPDINATSAHLLSARALIGTPHIDLFVPHALFNGAIGRAEAKLQNLLDQIPSSNPVSWGNTNTRPNEYAAALEAAEHAGRPVRFVAWGISPHLPRVSRQELLRRTVIKLRQTGRYIPAGAVGAALGRVERLVKEGQKEADKLLLAQVLANNNNENTTIISDNEYQFAMNVAFAALAGYEMDEDGFVTRVGEPRTSSQKSSSPSSLSSSFRAASNKKRSTSSLSSSSSSAKVIKKNTSNSRRRGKQPSSSSSRPRVSRR